MRSKRWGRNRDFSGKCDRKLEGSKKKGQREGHKEQFVGGICVARDASVR